MLSKVQSSAVHGIDAYPVEVETHMEGNVPAFGIVGLPDNTVRESRERVISAIKNSGFEFSYNRRITINLAPANLKKGGSAYDLPIAIGILTARGEISEEKLEDIVILGELALDGSIRPVRGMLSIAVEAKNQRRGIGELLLRELERKTGKVGIKRIYLHTATKNLSAQKLFARMGYRIAGIKKSFYPRGQDAFIMSKDIPRVFKNQGI